MSTITTPFAGTPETWKLPYRGKVGMACLIFGESAIFTIFVVAYLFYVGKSLTGPTPSEVLETPIFYTICLLSSSLTIHLAGKLLERGRRGGFLLLWLFTIVHESFWDNLLLAGRPARLSRYRWTDHAQHRAAPRLGWSGWSRTGGSRGRAFHVLALCGCRVGGCVHRRLRSRSLRK